MATTEMVSSYPSWIQTSWQGLFNRVQANTLIPFTQAAPVWDGPASSSTYITAINQAISELLAINVGELWDDLITKYSVMSHIGTLHEERYVIYVGHEANTELFIDELKALPRSDYIHTMGGRGDELYQSLLANEQALLDGIDLQLEKVNEGVKAGLVNVYQKAFEQHLNKGTLWSSVCYNWILERYDQLLGANREYTNKMVLDLLDKRLDRTAKLIEISGQTHGQGKQLSLTKDKMVLEGLTGLSERSGKVLELSSASYEKSSAVKHELANTVLQMTLQVEELQGKMKSAVTEMQYQFDMDIAKAAYAALITSKKWPLDLDKYTMEALAALQGASPQSRSSSETGWNAMSSTERGLTLASVGVSMASGISSILKDFF